MPLLAWDKALELALAASTPAMRKSNPSTQWRFGKRHYPSTQWRFGKRHYTQLSGALESATTYQLILIAIHATPMRPPCICMVVARASHEKHVA